jgi:hypothetical protein
MLIQLSAVGHQRQPAVLFGTDDWLSNEMSPADTAMDYFCIVPVTRQVHSERIPLTQRAQSVYQTAAILLWVILNSRDA